MFCLVGCSHIMCNDAICVPRIFTLDRALLAHVFFSDSNQALGLEPIQNRARKFESH